MVASTANAAQGGGANASEAKPAPSRIYLDTYLETVQNLPAEVQRILNTLKDLDATSQDLEFQAERKAERCLELPPQSSRNTTDEQKKELATLRAELDRLHNMLHLLANEKVELTKTAYELLQGHIDVLDEEMVKFDSEITLNTAQQELQQLHQEQADALAQAQAHSIREKSAPVSTTVRETSSTRDVGIKQGDQVAARTSARGEPDVWVIARVMDISSDERTFTILDEDTEEGGESSVHTLPAKQILKLPKAKERKQPKTFSDGSYVLAVFTGTTTFYRAYVMQQAKWQAKNGIWGPYVLAFDDDDDVNNPGYAMNRTVPFHHVVALPRDFKLG